MLVDASLACPPQSHNAGAPHLKDLATGEGMDSGAKAMQGRPYPRPEWVSELHIHNDKCLYLRENGPVMLLELKTVFTWRTLKPFWGPPVEEAVPTGLVRLEK